MNPPRRRLLVALVLLLALVAGACGSSKKSSTTSASTSTSSSASGGFTPAKPGQLTVATNLPAPGFWNGDDPSSLNGGYEWGIGQEMAKRLGLTMKVVNVSFDALVAGQAKGFDLALSQVTITDERKKVVDFSTPYFSSDQGIMVRKGTKVATLADAAKLQWGVQQSTTGQTFLADKVKPSKEVRVYGETTQAFTALQAGQVDAVLLDTTIVLGQASLPGSPFAVVGQFRTGEEYGAVIPKGSPNEAKIDSLIQAMKDDGTLGRLSDQYLKPKFGEDPSKVPYIQVS